VSLVSGPDGERQMPWSSRALESINKTADLDVDINFTESNAPNNTIFVVYAIYTDVGIVFDPKTKHFSSPYLQYMN